MAILRFCAALWRGFGATYDVQLRLVGKRLVDFLELGVSIETTGNCQII